MRDSCNGIHRLTRLFVTSDVACNGILHLAHDLENIASFHSVCYQEIFGNSRKDTIILRSEQG